jgi:hypothetical protein
MESLPPHFDLNDRLNGNRLRLEYKFDKLKTEK